MNIDTDFLPIICIASKTPTLVSPACWRFLFYKGDAEEGLLLQIDTAYPSLNEANFPYVVLCLLEKRQLVWLSLLLAFFYWKKHQHIPVSIPLKTTTNTKKQGTVSMTSWRSFLRRLAWAIGPPAPDAFPQKYALVVPKAVPINGPTHWYNLIYSEKVRKMAHRGCNQTYIRLFIINGLLQWHFRKAVHDDDPSVLFR